MQDDSEFQDALDEPLDAAPQLADGTSKFVDAQGYPVQLPKKWTYDNSFKFESEEVKKEITEVDPANCALTDEIRETKPLGKLINYFR